LEAERDKPGNINLTMRAEYDEDLTSKWVQKIKDRAQKFDDALGPGQALHVNIPDSTVEAERHIR
jgi:hypothetical protein